MTKRRTEYLVFLSFLLLLFFVPQIGFAGGKLKVVMFDIGQGDAIYIEAPNGHQMIIDGGPKNVLKGAVSEVMPFGDKSIDVIMITNPDADHMSGFTQLLDVYTIGSVVEPGTLSDTQTYKKLQQAIRKEGCPHVLARKGMSIILDKENGVHFDILFPDRDVRAWKRNDASIVGKLVYRNTSVMFMGDATTRTEGMILLQNKPSTLKSNVLKLGHHGSKTSSSARWLDTIKPTFGLISAGVHNRYGHPHQEVINRLNARSISILGTYEKGNITLLSDGNSFSKD